MTAVAREQRFTRQNPCPICGGWDTLQRGKGQRCSGFWNDDRTYVNCSRPEFGVGIEAGAGLAGEKETRYAVKSRLAAHDNLSWAANEIDGLVDVVRPLLRGEPARETAARSPASVPFDVVETFTRSAFDVCSSLEFTQIAVEAMEPR